MKTTIRMILGCILVLGIATGVTGEAFGQYLPPVIGNAYQLTILPNEVKSLQPAPAPAPSPRHLAAPASTQPLPQVRAEQPVPESQAEQGNGVNIVIVPVADSARSQPAQVVQTPPAAEAPQGMVAQTLFYFPPPTFPEPVPYTVYRPEMPMMQQAMPGQPMPGQMQQPCQDPSIMYAPPMLVQPQYFGTPKQSNCPSGFCNGDNNKKRGLFSKDKNKDKSAGPYGEPVVGPPSLVYPNGIVVRPKVYLPNQPFKNAVRSMTP